MPIQVDETVFETPITYKPKGEKYAFCSSTACVKKDSNGEHSLAIGKIIECSRHTTFCPKCDSALFWTNYEDIYNKKSVFKK